MTASLRSFASRATWASIRSRRCSSEPSGALPPPSISTYASRHSFGMASPRYWSARTSPLTRISSGRSRTAVRARILHDRVDPLQDPRPCALRRELPPHILPPELRPLRRLLDPRLRGQVHGDERSPRLRQRYEVLGHPRATRHGPRTLHAPDL